MKRTAFILLMVVILFTLVVFSFGCSTLTSGSSTTVSVDWPDGGTASCEVTLSGVGSRSGSTVTVSLTSVNTSGGTVTNLTGANFLIFYSATKLDLTSTTETAAAGANPDSIETIGEEGGDTATAKDILFVIDSTGSMGEEINGVVSSVSSFAAEMENRGVNGIYGGVAYSDTYVDSIDFTNATSFSSWANSLFASGGGDYPENPYDVIVSGLTGIPTYSGYTLNWRSGAQKIMIILTDATAHYGGDGDGYTTNTSTSVTAVLNDPAYTVQVHTVSITTAEITDDPYQDGEDVRLLAANTGGSQFDMPSDGNIDLTTLIRHSGQVTIQELSALTSILSAVSGGYLLTTTGDAGYYIIIADINKNGVFGDSSDGVGQFYIE